MQRWLVQHVASWILGNSDYSVVVNSFALDSLVAVVVLAGTRWYRGANICATVLVRILFRLPRSIAPRDKYGMERIEMVYEESARLGDT